MAKKKSHRGLGLLTLAAAAAAGALFVYGKSAKANRQKVKSWALKAKAEVLEKLEQAKELDREDYEAAIDAVARKYRALKHVDKGELSDVVDDLKSHWTSVKRQIKTAEQKELRKRK